VALAVVLVLGTLGVWLAVNGSGGSGNPQAAARTSFPGLTPASGAPALPSLSTLHPAPGSVVEAEGPFDDRFRFRRLAFDGSVLTGTAEITSDVSDVLEFEAVAGFYDRSGALVGTARHTYHLDESQVEPHDGPPDETQHFKIVVPPRLRGAAVAAAVGVPVLVNE
jgi:hypothetical protein